MAPKAMFSKSRAPELGAWVMLSDPAATSTKKRKTLLVAMVTAVDTDAGQSTLVLPNMLVLLHGFKGSSMRRICGIEFSKLRPLEDTAGSRVDLGRQLLKALRQERRAPTAPPTVEEPPPTVEEAPLTLQEAPPTVAEAPPTVEEAPPTVETAPPKVERAPPTVERAPPRERSRTPPRRVAATEKALARQNTPQEPPKPASGVTKLDRKKLRDFTVMVSKSLRECGGDDLQRMQLEKLRVALAKGFSAPEITAGLQQLEDACKIAILDQMIFSL